MATRTPDSVIHLTAGNGTRRLRASFADIDDGDTWATGMSGIVNIIALGTDDPTTQASNGIDTALSSGTITFYPGEDNRVVNVIIECRS